MTCNCERCAWAEFEQAEDVGRFEAIWNSAPRERTRLTMKEDAEYWFLRGQAAGRDEVIRQENADLRQMIQLAQERLR